MKFPFWFFASLASLGLGAPVSGQLPWVAAGDRCLTAGEITGPGDFLVDASGTLAFSPPDPESATGLVESVWLRWTPCVTGVYSIAYVETLGGGGGDLAIYDCTFPCGCPGTFTGLVTGASGPSVILAVSGGDTYYFEIGTTSPLPNPWEGTVTITGFACPDNDGDGYDSSVDCNDFNPNVNPGATEICGNGIDEDCDGTDPVCPMSNGCGAATCDIADVIGPGPGVFCADSAGTLAGPTVLLEDDVWLIWTPCVSGVHEFSYADNGGFLGAAMRISNGCPGTKLGLTGSLFGSVSIPVSVGQTYYLEVGNLTSGSNFPYSGTITITGPACPSPDSDMDGWDATVDCDDNDSNVYPGAPEICGNGVDEDCDGVDPACAPPNDTCEGASLLPSGANSVAYDTGLASASGVTPSCGSGENVDLWYRWSPDSLGTWRFSTCGTTNYDGRLTLYDACDGTELGCTELDSNCLNGTTSLLNVTGLSIENDYLLQVGGFDSEAGTGTVDISLVPYDTCEEAQPISCDGTFSFDTTGHTHSGRVVDMACAAAGNSSGQIYKDYWFEWTACESGVMTATIDSLVDVVIAVLDGNDCENSLVADCDDVVALGGDQVQICVQTGNSYLIAIGGWHPDIAEDAPGTVDISVQPDPCINYCIAAPNSVSDSGAWITYQNSLSISANDTRLVASDCPLDEFGVFYFGTAAIETPFGNGYRCVGGFTTRLLPPVNSGSSGTATYLMDLTSFPASQIGVGSPWFFQFWYRDPDGGTPGFNLSNGMELTFLP